MGRLHSLSDDTLVLSVFFFFSSLFALILEFFKSFSSFNVQVANRYHSDVAEQVGVYSQRDRRDRKPAVHLLRWGNVGHRRTAESHRYTANSPVCPEWDSKTPPGHLWQSDILEIDIYRSLTPRYRLGVNLKLY